MDKKSFILTNVGLVWHGSLFNDKNVIGPFGIETKESPKLPILQTLNNPINICLINLNIFICYF